MSLCIACIVLLVLIIPTSSDKGSSGEKAVAQILSVLPEPEYTVLNNVMLRSDFGLTQIDHIIVSLYGIFVIETKNYKGWITGGEYADNWTKNMYRKKYSFRNPLKQNYAHIKALMNLLEVDNQEFFISIIAFSRNADVKVVTSKNVIYYDELINTIWRYHSSVFTIDQVSEYVNRIRSANVDSEESRNEHIWQIKNTVYARESAVQQGICPRCGKNLVLRNGRYGQFWGCSGYPSCRFTLNIK